MRLATGVVLPVLLAGAPAQAAPPPSVIIAAEDLPRAGYETGRWRLGSGYLMPSLTATSRYDSNVFATSKDTRSDAVFNIAPNLDYRNTGRGWDLRANAYADFRLLARYTTENAAAYGASAAGEFDFSAASRVTAGLGFAHAVEARSDPEANPVLVNPARLNTVQGNVGYTYSPGRLGLTVRGAWSQVRYRDAADADRDYTSYGGSLRLFWGATPRFNPYLQPYVLRRDARLPVDFNGVDHDVTTVGVLGGTTIAIADRWSGDFGVGAFRANPDGPLESFTGLAVRGNLAWSPTPRTVLTLNALSGDVATVRAGANGRIDTVVGLRLDEEVRHNLLLNAGIAFDRTSYRSNLQRVLRTLTATVEVQYLINRNLRLFVAGSHTDRRADDPLDRFVRTTAAIGIRVAV